MTPTTARAIYRLPISTCADPIYRSLELMNERLRFTEEEWANAIPEVVRAMTEHIRPYCTPVSKHHGDYADPWGTGTYLRLRDRVFILTNQHVAATRSTEQQLIHQMHGLEDLFVVVGHHAAEGWPLDLAILPAETGWHHGEHDARAISLDQISIAHDPAPTELFTFYGFCGERAGFHFGTLLSRGTCSIAREVPLPCGEPFNSRFHFGLDYRPELAKSVLSTQGLPRPPGFSGSGVWNTRLVDLHSHRLAAPDHANGEELTRDSRPPDDLVTL
jgi:hypothetical protein